MAHALIIDDNMAVSRAIQARLIAMGFNSFDHTWSEGQALSVAQRRSPDLVVVGDEIAGGSATRVAQRFAERLPTPILVVSNGCCEVRRRLPGGPVVDGPFLLSDIDAAVTHRAALAAWPRRSAASGSVRLRRALSRMKSPGGRPP